MSITSASNPSSSASRVGTHRDVLGAIASHLDRSTQLHCLTISTTFYLAIIPHIYHTIDFGYKYIREANEGERRVQQGGKNGRRAWDDSDVRRYVNPFLGADSKVDSPFSKPAVLRYVKAINFFEHEIEMCSAIPPVPALPSLELLHLAGGGRPHSKGTHPCQTKDCRVLATIVPSVKTVVSRDSGWGSQGGLPPLRDVETVIMKIRPCQFPEASRREHLKASDDNKDGFDYGKDNPFGGLSTAKYLDLVLWDETHRHRIDFTHPTWWNPDANHGRGEPNRPYKDCRYCNQFGCKRSRPHGREDLPDLMRRLGRWTDLKYIRVFNADHVAMYGFSYDYEYSTGLSQVHESIVEAFKKGREYREKLDAKLAPGVDVEEGADRGKGKVEEKEDFHVNFRSAREYLDLAFSDPHQAVDEREMEYWEKYALPSNSETE